ncbi:isoprene synthase, chloroplastic-like [Coffea arabica]|uniref:Isoprene synthase, chloroplastic-like n=1 Tax=Coffea arabica TaxID=13443 RepID=A0ABM4UFX0_COFAR
MDQSLGAEVVGVGIAAGTLTGTLVVETLAFVIYKEIRERFSNHLWLDVLSKCDLLEESPVVYVTEDVNCDDYELAKYRKMGPDGALRVSVKSEMGLDEWEIQMTILKKLEEEVRYMLDDENLEPQSLLELVHDIDRLGISYKYRGTIREALDRLKSLKEATTEITKDLHLSALYFRLLRQHGYEASPDIFERFRDRSGNFGNLGRSLAKDVRGILSLYEASHLAYEGEETLQEAKSFTSLHLKSLKELVDSNMSEEIKHALELPYHHRMRRLEAWWNIETCAKRNGKNQILLELAKLDFNMVQSVLQGDLQDVLR